MKFPNILIQFICILSIGLSASYLIQNAFIENSNGLSLPFTYGFNLIFTLPVMILIFIFIDKLKPYIGFTFMGIGVIKIIVFLLYTKLQGIDVNRDNFLMFFVPYFICLIAEIFVLSKYLNKAEF